MDRGDVSGAVHEVISLRCMNDKAFSLSVPKTVSFDDVALREPADANVFVPVCTDNILFIFCQQESSEQRGMSQY